MEIFSFPKRNIGTLTQVLHESFNFLSKYWVVNPGPVAQRQVLGPLGVIVAQSQLSLLLTGVAARARGFRSRF